MTDNPRSAVPDESLRLLADTYRARVAEALRALHPHGIPQIVHVTIGDDGGRLPRDRWAQWWTAVDDLLTATEGTGTIRVRGGWVSPADAPRQSACWAIKPTHSTWAEPGETGTGSTAPCSPSRSSTTSRPWSGPRGTPRSSTASRPTRRRSRGHGWGAGR